MTQSPPTNAKGFSKAFWVSNTVELFERMAYYAVFIVLTIYLSNILGFNDFEASMISGLFSGGLYLLPIFTGAYADKIGFRKSMIIAFALLSAGYLGLGVLPTLLEAAGLVEYGEVTRFSGLVDSSERWMIVPVLFVIMLGGSFIKSIISASVAKETTEATRARGYSIFYMMVNFGAFTGKTIIDPLRNAIGEQAYIYINFFSATMTILALLSVILLYKSAHTAGEGTGNSHGHESWRKLEAYDDDSEAVDGARFNDETAQSKTTCEEENHAPHGVAFCVLPVKHRLAIFIMQEEHQHADDEEDVSRLHGRKE